MKNYWLKKHRQVPVWDFQTFLGDVIKENHKSSYVRIVEVSDVFSVRWGRNKKLLVDQINTDSGDSAI